MKTVVTNVIHAQAPINTRTCVADCIGIFNKDYELSITKIQKKKMSFLVQIKLVIFETSQYLTA